MVQELRPLTHSPSHQQVKPLRAGTVGRGDPPPPEISWVASQQEVQLGPACQGAGAQEGLESLSGDHRKSPRNLSASMGGTPAQVHRSPWGGLPTSLLHRLRQPAETASAKSRRWSRTPTAGRAPSRGVFPENHQSLATGRAEQPGPARCSPLAAAPSPSHPLPLQAGQGS